MTLAVAASAGASAQTAINSNGSFISRQPLHQQAAAKAQLADNQRYVGNDIADYCNTGLGITGYTGTMKCGGMIDKALLANYIGCKIVGMRFYLCEPVGASTAFVTTVASYNSYINDSPVLQAEVADTHQGWNDVMFDRSYTIDEATTLRGYMAGYTFEQGETKPNTPIAVSGTGVTMGFMIYGNLSEGPGWYNMGKAEGNLMTQLIIQRDGGFLAYDISMDQFLPAVVYAKAGGTNSLGVICHNVGTADIAEHDATFGVSVDGVEVAQFDNADAIAAGDTPALVEAAVNMPGNLATGSHDLAVYVKSVGGNAPEGNLNNDRITCAFKAYTESFPRQKQLVEQFTSQYCIYCPRGYDVLNGLAAKRDDLAWIAYHGDMGEAERDEYTLADSYNFMAVACGGNLPAAAVNRYYYDYSGINFYNTIGITTAYPSSETAAGTEVFNELIDMSEYIYPSFTTIDLATAYDADTRHLDIKVSGKTAAQFDEMFGSDAAISVYLTEDGLWGKQKNGDRMMARYPHDHTLRMFVKSQLDDGRDAASGEALDAADGTYSKSYTVTLDPKWDADNMNVIAVVSRPMNIAVRDGRPYITSKGTDLWVDNAEIVKVGSSATAIRGISENADIKQSARIYTLDGTYVGISAASLPKGMYIQNGRKFVK